MEKSSGTDYNMKKKETPSSLEVIYASLFPDHHLHEQQPHDERAALAVADLSVHQRVGLENTQHTGFCTALYL